MKNRYLLIPIFLFIGCISFAQTAIKGRVLDNDVKEPISGVAVIIKNTKTGVVTDENGIFELTGNISLPVTLTIVYSGYRSEELDIYEAESFDVFLQEDINKLEEVVVTGVAEGTTRQKLSFALTKIDSRLINSVPATDASTTLRGKVAGLRVDQSDGNKGASVYLRGSKSVSGGIEPLIVVDGFVTGLRLSDINPGDIESIEVVKGAAASALWYTR
jgi:outer membrane receptor protein involved in Fe transport